MHRSPYTVLTALTLALALAVGAVFAADHHDVPDTVVDVAVENEGFSTLVAAVTEAELVATLQGDGPFTVFAPTDEAFAEALEALDITAEELLASPDLAGILTYHVVPGALMAEDVLAAVEAGMGSATVETVNGASIDVTVEDGMVMLNGTATVTTVDLEAGNGVVHVIDAVILPPSE
ncbi:MAG: fasciclin domain-containing protein [Trueperaceae bacterium]